MGRSTSGRSQLTQLLDRASFPIYIVDILRKIVYANAACCLWLGIEDADQLVGLRCDYHSDPNATDSSYSAAGLCPPPEAFTGKEVTATVTNEKATERRSTRFVPLSDEPIACPGVLVLVGSQPLKDDDRGTVQTEEAIQLHDRIREIRRELKKPFQLEQLLGASAAAKRIRRQVQLAVEGRPNILVIGPAGSGREHIARTIHYAANSDDQRPLLPLTGNLLDAELLQSTIDGLIHRSTEQLSDAASTLLLLEADQMPPDAQAVLMRFLSARELRLHVLSTAKTSLLELASRGEYQADLAYSLSTLQIELPSLADRRRDIPILAQAAVERVNARGTRQMSGLTADALDRLAEFAWTRNTDELFEVIAQAHQQADGPYIQVKDLPDRVRLAREAATMRRPEPKAIDLDRYLTDIETELIKRALTQSTGNKAQAAKLLGISRARLLRRLEQLKIGG